MESIIQRIGRLRVALRENHAQWYLCATADPHGSEYINEHYKEREYLSGFTGSAGTLLIGPEEACLWTDGRYFVQAEKELQGSGICLMRMGDAGVPQLTEYIEDTMPAGDTLLLDGKLFDTARGRKLAECLKGIGAHIRIGKNLLDALWTDRPKDSAEEIRILPSELYGKEYREKLSDLRDAVAHKGAVGMIISSLEDQMWLFNIRGADIAYNPVAYAYTVVTAMGVSLYVKEEAVSDELCAYAVDEDITLKPYEDFYKDLPRLRFDGAVLIDPDKTNYLITRILQRSEVELVEALSPLTEAKAVKSEKEIEAIRRIYLEDSAVLTRFLMYVKKQAPQGGMDELSLSQKLDAMRAQIPGFRDLSFTTISAFGPNAAMMHYEATQESHSPLGKDGFYLVDSGGQYDGGTTDVTRTLALGTVEKEHKKQFTRVCAGMLALQNAVFLRGCGGRNLDILARGPVWELDMDYKCGTGHGVGYMLSVHEGPHGIRWKQLKAGEDAVLEPGMLVSDEPGVYVAGSHGIRIENILLVRKKTENTDGEFLCFEPLTWVPVDRDAILAEELQPKEKQQLNEYHATVREKLLPFMQSEEEKNMLLAMTECIL